MPDKKALRAELHQFRRHLAHRKARQHLINQALRDFPLPPQPKVAVYAALPNEVRVDDLVHRLLAAGQMPIYPLVMPGQLHFISCAPSELSVGYKRILEPPKDGQRVPLKDLHAIILPGLGFTCEGDRLGYGGGWYDRTLYDLSINHPHIHRIGVCFQGQVLPALPVESHDVRATALVTEWGWRHCPPTKDYAPERARNRALTESV